MKNRSIAAAGRALAVFALLTASTVAFALSGDHEAMQFTSKLVHYLGRLAMPIASLAVALVGVSMLRERPRRRKLRIRKH